MKRIDDKQLTRTVAALASAGAGAVHFAVLPAHLREWWAAGVFFAAIAAFQVVWAGLALTSRRRMLLFLGVVANAATAALWGWTRIAGLPFGPNAGVPEHVDLAGVVTAVLEVAVCAGVAWTLRPAASRPLPSAATPLVTVAGAVLLVSGVAVPGVIAGAGHQHSPSHSHSGGDHHDGQGHSPEQVSATPSADASRGGHHSGQQGGSHHTGQQGGSHPSGQRGGDSSGRQSSGSGSGDGHDHQHSDGHEHKHGGHSH